MIKLKHRRLLLSVLTITLFASLTVNETVAQSNKVAETKLQEVAETKLPSGNWSWSAHSFSAHPYWSADYGNLPVVVYSVTSDERARIAKVGVKNFSDKSVVGIRFGWFLTTEEDLGTILQHGQTPLLEIENLLSPSDIRILVYPVTSIGKIYKPLLKDGVLNGDFNIFIGVEEIRYSDGTIWKLEKTQGKARQRNRKPIFVSASAIQCPRQKCKSNVAGTGETVYYTCEPSTLNETCSNSANARSCTNNACGFGGGIGGIEP
ncbi:MAG: hypothetical protein LC754_02135 [Acidobacteria bacterium]|nr:hypothetical protein [Acidobacteriota bacterium]